MRFGISILQTGEDLDDVRELSTLAEECDFDLLGIPDSHSILRDCYVAMTICAQATSQIRIGPMVTNPVTRHPSVTASAMQSISEVSCGRAFLGIAAGNSAVYNVGMAPSGSAGLAEAVAQIRAMLQGARPTATRAPLAWTVPDEIPIYIAGSGPKSIAVAGRLADGVVLDLGADPAMVGKAARLAHQSHAEGPRADHPFEVWVLGKSFISDDPAQAREGVSTIMAASANDAFRWQLEWKEVPVALRPALLQFHQRYSFVHHASTKSTRTSNVDLLGELGLTEFIYDRFAMIGPGEAVARRLNALAEVGVDGVTFTGAIADKALFMRRFRDDVRPLLAGPSASV